MLYKYYLRIPTITVYDTFYYFFSGMLWGSNAGKN